MHLHNATVRWGTHIIQKCIVASYDVLITHFFAVLHKKCGQVRNNLERWQRFGIRVIQRFILKEFVLRTALSL